jgi:hypothetical protein
MFHRKLRAVDKADRFVAEKLLLVVASLPRQQPLL